MLLCCACVRVCVCVGSLAGGIVAFSAPSRRGVCLLPGRLVGPLRWSPTSNGRRSGLPPVCRPWGLRSYCHPKASLSPCVPPHCAGSQSTAAARLPPLAAGICDTDIGVEKTSADARCLHYPFVGRRVDIGLDRCRPKSDVGRSPRQTSAEPADVRRGGLATQPGLTGISS